MFCRLWSRLRLASYNRGREGGSKGNKDGVEIPLFLITLPPSPTHSWGVEEAIWRDNYHRRILSSHLQVTKYPTIHPAVTTCCFIITTGGTIRIFSKAKNVVSIIFSSYIIFLLLYFLQFDWIITTGGFYPASFMEFPPFQPYSPSKTKIGVKPNKTTSAHPAI